MSHISKVNSDRFESAVRKALANIIADKQAFCLNDVIRKARYPDGSAVGATTLYAKNSEGQYVHATLLAHIKAASVRSKLRGRASAKKSSGHPNETLTANGEPTALYRQLLEQESRLQELDRNLASLNLQLRRAQEEKFIALSTLNRITGGAVLDLVRPLRELEAQLGITGLTDHLKATAEKLAQRCVSLIRSK